MVEKVFTYALGRELGYSDGVEVKEAVAYVKANGYTLRALLKFVVGSQLFRAG